MPLLRGYFVFLIPYLVFRHDPNCFTKTNPLILHSPFSILHSPVFPPALIFNSPLCPAMADHFGGTIQPADAGHTQTRDIYGAVITVSIAATIAVILRFVARRKSEAHISYDDYSIVLALVNNSPLLYAHLSNKSLIRSSGVSLRPQYQYNPCRGDLGPGKTLLLLVRRSTSPLSKGEYTLALLEVLNLTHI